MYEVSYVCSYRRSVTYCVSLRDALRIVENPNFNGHIRFLDGIFAGCELRKGLLTNFLDKMLN